MVRIWFTPEPLDIKYCISNINDSDNSNNPNNLKTANNSINCDIYMSLAAAMAQAKHTSKSIKIYTYVLKKYPYCTSAYFYRSRLLKDTHPHLALKDLNIMVTISPTYEAYASRALLLYHHSCYRSAKIDFEKSLLYYPTNHNTWNNIGLCLYHMHKYDNAISAFNKSLDLKYLNSTVINLARCYAQHHQHHNDYHKHNNNYNYNYYNNHDDDYNSHDDNYNNHNYNNYNQDHQYFYQTSDKYFTLALKNKNEHISSKTLAEWYYMRANNRFEYGKNAMALMDFDHVLRLNPDHQDGFLKRATIYHCSGQFGDACTSYIYMLQKYPTSYALHLLKLCIFWNNYASIPFQFYNTDIVLTPYHKEALYRQRPLNTHTLKVKNLVCHVQNINEHIIIQPSLVRMANHLGMYIGHNVRQQRAAGFAILEIAQMASRCWNNALDGHHTYISDVHHHKHMSSFDTHQVSDHRITWVDIFNIAVKWMQHVDVNHTVFWSNMLTEKLFKTSCATVYHKNIKTRIMSTFKHLCTQKWPKYKKDIDAASTYQELHNIKKNIHVMVPCLSIIDDTVNMNGMTMRLKSTNTLISSCQLKCNIINHPSRCTYYNGQLDMVWNLLMSEIFLNQLSTYQSIYKAPHISTHQIPPYIWHNYEKICDILLIMLYYWCVYSPLTNDNSTCGIIVLMGLLLSFETQIDLPISHQEILWDALLTPCYHEFVSTTSKHIYPTRRHTSPLNNLPSVNTSIPDLANLIAYLNYPPN